MQNVSIIFIYKLVQVLADTMGDAFPEIRERKDTLLDELQADNQKFTSLWNQLFIKREESSKSEFIGGIIANSITAIDVFLMVRKLLKSYRMIL